MFLDYCSKQGCVVERGEIPDTTQGARTDLEEISKKILGDRTNVLQIAEEYPSHFIRYHRGIERLCSIARRDIVREWKTTVYVIYGDPGTGKSRWCNAMARELGGPIYYKPRGNWWDGYFGQKCIIIDDFYGWIKYDELLKISDRYPYQVPIKGSYEQFLAEHLFITSNTHYDNWYKFDNYDSKAFERRIDFIKEINDKIDFNKFLVY